MKKIYLVLFISACLVQAKAQNTFQALYGNTDNFFANGSMATAVVQNADGSFMMAGHTDDYAALGDLFLLKTDATGAVIWYKNYTVTDPDKKSTEVSSLTKTADGGYIIGGKVYGVFGNDDLLVLKTDSAGNVQWHKVFGAQGNSTAKAIKQTTSGEYIVLGTAEDLGIATSFRPALYAIKLSVAGDSIWTKTFNYNATSIAVAADVQVTSDGNFVIGGTITKNLDSADADRLPVMLKINSANGNIIWSKSFGSAQLNPLNEIMNDFVIAPDGSFIITGVAYPDYGKANGLMMKIDADGNIIQWAKRYKTNDSSEYENFQSLTAANNGYAMYGNAFSFATSKQFGLAVATDLNGNVDWANHVGNGNNNYGYSVIATQDNGYLFGGYEIADFNFNSTTTYVLKANTNGSTGCYESPVDFTVTNENYSVGAGPFAFAGGGGIGGETMSVADAEIPVTVLCQNPAPQLQFTAFNANKTGNNNILSWRTKSELKSDKYYIQRSNNKTAVNMLGELDATYKTLSNKPYSFTDNKPLNGTNYYRIKAVSKTGKITYSKIESISNRVNSIRVSNTLIPGVVLFQSEGEFDESITSVLYSVYNSFGNKVYDGKLNINSGKIFTTANLSSLQNGIYYVNFNADIYLPKQQVIINK